MNIPAKTKQVQFHTSTHCARSLLFLCSRFRNKSIVCQCVRHQLSPTGQPNDRYRRHQNIFALEMSKLGVERRPPRGIWFVDVRVRVETKNMWLYLHTNLRGTWSKSPSFYWRTKDLVVRTTVIAIEQLLSDLRKHLIEDHLQPSFDGIRHFNFAIHSVQFHTAGPETVKQSQRNERLQGFTNHRLRSSRCQRWLECLSVSVRLRIVEQHCEWAAAPGRSLRVDIERRRSIPGERTVPE